MNRTETTQEKTGNEIGHAESRTDDVVQPKDAVQDAAARGQALTGYETLTAWQTAKKFKWCTFFAVIAAFSAATDGYQIALNSGIIVNPGFVEQFATDTNAKGKPVLASNVIAAWGTILPVGQFIASSSLPFISARFGRKVAMYITVIFLAASVIAESLARKWPHWLVAKLLAGIGTGCMQVNMTTYVTEISPTRLRGRILMTYNLWWTVGQLFTYIALEVLSHQHPKSWLIPVYTQWTHVGLMAIIYFFLPESPAWAVATGHMNRARKSLTSLYRGVEGFDVEHQLQVLKLLADHEAEVAALQLQERWWAIFKGVDGFRTLVALWTLCSQQFIGLTLFTSYGTYFFQQAELGNPFQIKCITIGVKLVAAVCVVYVADSVGRRMISCSGATTMWLSCLIIGILSVVPRNKAVNAVCIMLAVFWNMGLTMTGATGWGFIAEMSSQRLRHYTSGAAAAINAVTNIGMNQLIPHMINANEWNWGLKTGFLYAGIGCPVVVGIWLLIPETAGRSAAELDELFERKIKPWRFHKTETATQRIVAINAAQET